MTVNQMRNKIADVYKGPRWRAEVLQMPDRQVIAIYKDMAKRGAFEPKKPFPAAMKLYEEPDCIQMTIWDYMKKE